jgi:aquaporin Z
MKKYLVEFIGTFFLVFTVGMTVIAPGIGGLALAPLAIGSALMIMVYAGGHISGGHYNPAVTLAATLRGACQAKDAASYMVVQALGAVVAAVAVRYLKGDAMAAVAAADRAMGPSLLAEFLFTFALCYVVLNTATAKGTAGNSFYGLAIGFTVVVGVFAVANVSGGALNPAVALGATMLGLVAWSKIWIYLVAELVAAVVAALVFKLVNPPEAA